MRTALLVSILFLTALPLHANVYCCDRAKHPDSQANANIGPSISAASLSPNASAEVVGPNIGLWSSHFISKPPFKGKATPWHEDSSYWNGRVSTMEGICTVWLALDRAMPENGCMSVIPGTHKNGFSEYEPVNADENIFGTEIKADQFDESAAVYFCLEPNECSLHEARIIHGAKANTSPYRRAGYTMRYFPTTSKVYPEHNKGHKIWLARGKDIAGNQYEG